jgi:hypothetical protein
VTSSYELPHHCVLATRAVQNKSSARLSVFSMDIMAIGYHLGRVIRAAFVCATAMLLIALAQLICVQGAKG